MAISAFTWLNDVSLEFCVYGAATAVTLLGWTASWRLLKMSLDWHRHWPGLAWTRAAQMIVFGWQQKDGFW